MTITHNSAGFLARYSVLSQERPTAWALFALGRPALSRGDLTRQVTQATRELRRRVAKPHSRIVLALPPGPEMALAGLAAMEAGTAIPINPESREAECVDLFQQVRPDLLLVPSQAGSAAIKAAHDQRVPITS
jgi:acyl-CoA synthetase (AMP-forming)/AMP-acid ligase II